MQMNRLFKIVYYLLENGKSTAPELAEKFEVSIRTIYRDLDAISAAGIPIYATQGKGERHILVRRLHFGKIVAFQRRKRANTYGIARYILYGGKTGRRITF